MPDEATEKGFVLVLPGNVFLQEDDVANDERDEGFQLLPEDED